ncbi:hypothetical protein M8J75_001820 [Diaphorina citri]|nr:hypothetical protein M8J75_001820 [Diaphorina citri]
MEINLVNINKMLTELCKSKFTLKHLGDSVSIRTTNITDYELIKKKLKEINKMYHTFTPTDRRDPFHPPKRRRTVVVVKNLTQWAGAGSGESADTFYEGYRRIGGKKVNARGLLYEKFQVRRKNLGKTDIVQIAKRRKSTSTTPLQSTDTDLSPDRLFSSENGGCTMTGSQAGGAISIASQRRGVLVVGVSEY